MKRICFIVCFLFAGNLGLLAQQAVDSLHREVLARQASIAGQMDKADIRHFVIRVPDGKYGYTVFVDGQLYIEQTSIPSIAGTAGFATTEDADRVARRVVDKIRRGEMPPSVSMNELQEMGIVD